MDYVLPQTALAGLSYAGIAVAGIYGVYSEVPEDPENPGNPGNPDTPGFPPRQALNMIFSLNGNTPNVLRGTLTWSLDSGGEGASSASGTLYATTANRPRPFMRLCVGVGSLANLLWSGIITSVDTEAFGSNIDGTKDFSYQIQCVGWYHYAVRRQISITKQDCYAEDILRDIIGTYLNNQISISTMSRGRYYSLFSEKEQQISAIFQKLAQDSECIWYIDQYKRFYFLEEGKKTAPFHVSYTPTWSYGWDVPNNNFNNLKISEQGEQVVTRLFLHASSYVSHSMTYKWRPSGAGLVTTASNETPIVATVIMPGALNQAHDLIVGDTVRIEAVDGNDGANGTWIVSAQTFTKVTLEGSAGTGDATPNTGRWYLQERTISSTALDEGAASFTGSGQWSYYTLSSGQRQFMTEYPIAYVKSISAKWIYYRLDGTFDYYNKKWFDPMHRHRGGAGSIQGGYHVGANEQIPKLYNTTSSKIENNKSQIDSGGWWNTETWKPTNHRMPTLNWELSSEESGRSITESIIAEEDPPLTGFQQEAGSEFPFDWKIGYGSNTVDFIAEIETTESEEPGKIKFVRFEIDYAELVDSTSTYTNRDQISTIKSYDSATNGLIDLHAHVPELTTVEQKNAYRDAFFALRGEELLSASYTHLIESNGVINQKLYPGMSQWIPIHGVNTKLIIQSVSFNIINNKVPVLEASVKLATKQRDLAGLVQRLLTGR